MTYDEIQEQLSIITMLSKRPVDHDEMQAVIFQLYEEFIEFIFLSGLTVDKIDLLAEQVLKAADFCDPRDLPVIDYKTAVQRDVELSMMTIRQYATQHGQSKNIVEAIDNLLKSIQQAAFENLRQNFPEKK